MKTILILSSLILFITSAFLPTKKYDLRKQLMGTWVYQVSRTGLVEVKVKTTTPIFAYKMHFGPCNDSIALKSMPATVQNMRRANDLHNLSSKWYKQDGSLIDTYFPVKLPVDGKPPYHIQVINYGNRFKGDYYIVKLSADTLVILNDFHYTVDSIDYPRLDHVYIRQH